MIWDILIASVYARTTELSALLEHLSAQAAPYDGQVRILVDRDDCDLPVGAKRTRLLESATADYVCFVDDDDWVADDYVARVMDVLGGLPDVVGFWLRYVQDGIEGKPAKHSIMFAEWAENERLYERTPNHLNPTRRDLAVQGLPFLDGFGEDLDWSRKIRSCLRVESFLLWPPVYEYRFSTRSSLFSGGPVRVGSDPGFSEFDHVKVLP